MSTATKPAVEIGQQRRDQFGDVWTVKSIRHADTCVIVGLALWRDEDGIRMPISMVEEMEKVEHE